MLEVVKCAAQVDAVTLGYVRHVTVDKRTDKHDRKTDTDCLFKRVTALSEVQHVLQHAVKHSSFSFYSSSAILMWFPTGR